MKKLACIICVGAAAIVVALAMGVASARAGTAVVHLGSCANTGSTTVPAGSTISLFDGAWEVNKGLVHNWLNDQTSVISVNGGRSVNIDSLYSAPSTSQPFGGAPPGTWLTYFVYPTGITLVNPGDTMTVTLTITLARLLAEQVNGPIGFALGASPGTVFFTPGSIATFNCTITAT